MSRKLDMENLSKADREWAEQFTQHRMAIEQHEHEQELQRQAAKADKSSSDADLEGTEVPPYDEWTVPELQQELAKRKLPTTGRKPDLVARLEEDDARP